MPNKKITEIMAIPPQVPGQKPVPGNQDVDAAAPFDKLVPECIVVGIGASAGGLEALIQMLPGLPQGANMAFVIVQHLDPKHRSMLSSLLERHAGMPVTEIVDGQGVSADHIYITPAGNDLKLIDNGLHLTKPGSEIGPKPSIDYFFTSLAEAKAENAVGVILSGTGSDGAHGIRAIKAAGGITIAQRKDTAKYGSMPQAAIETGRVDLVVAPEDIGKELQMAIRYPDLITGGVQPADASKTLQRILKKITDRVGVRFEEYKSSIINRRVGRRMALQKVTHLSDYLAYIEQVPEELDLLFKDILISVTGFFRDTEAFLALDPVIDQMLQNKRPGEDIRIWIPGCATGEEAYSIAMLVSEHLEKAGRGYNNVQIFATDLDQEALFHARKGAYPAALVADIGEDRLKRHFLREDSTVQVKINLREMIVFAKQDVTRDPPFSHLDLISCRNLLIYFNAAMQKKIASMFHYVLNPEGILFLGKSESIGPFAELFQPVSNSWRIFRRRQVMRLQAPEICLGGYPRHFSTGTYRKTRREKEKSIRNVLADALLSTFAHCAVLIDDRLEIVYVQGDASPFLKLAQGEAQLNILNMVRDPLRLNLRSVIHKATRDACLVRSNPILFEENGNPWEVRLQAGPAGRAEGELDLTLVIFEQIPVKPAPARSGADDEGEPEDPQVMELKQDLAAMREHLQTTMEELETANEELQSLNEELQSANEELQSSNEELQTSNEELQSTNEELTTVNEELQVKTNELASTTGDLEHILKQTEIALVIVDRRLVVTRFTPSATTFFHLTASDIGHPLQRIPAAQPIENLGGALERAMETASPVELDFMLNTRQYTLRLRPYLGEMGQTVGAILLFVDRTDTLEWECVLDQSRRCQAAILDGVDNGIVIVGEGGLIESYNPAAERIFDLPASAAIGKPIQVLQAATIDGEAAADLSRFFDPDHRGGAGRRCSVSLMGMDGGLQQVALSVSVIKMHHKNKVLGIFRAQGRDLDDTRA